MEILEKIFSLIFNVPEFWNAVITAIGRGGFLNVVIALVENFKVVK